jgi:hypothetical protein
VPNVCQDKSKGVGKKATGWDSAIADAKDRIRQLRQTVQVYEARKRAGDQWPGDPRLEPRN